MAKVISETFYGRGEPQWLVESPKEQQSHFDQRGCVRQIKSSIRTHTIEPDVHTTHRPKASYFAEELSDHRQAHVYNTAPAITHRIAPNTSFINLPVVEFMVPLCCGKCEEKVKEELENEQGVYRVVCDVHNQKVTVSSNLDPNWLLKRVRRIKRNSHFWSGSTDAYYFPSQKPSYHSQPAHYVDTRRSSPPTSPCPEYYYGGVEYPYKSSRQQHYNDVHVYDDVSGTTFSPVPLRMHHDHLPSSYELPYDTEDYALYY